MATDAGAGGHRSPLWRVGRHRALRRRPADAREATISHHTWIHRGVRVLVRPLVGTPVTPNHLTGLRLISGLAAALAFAVGSTPGRWLGSGLVVMSVVLDRADGELARLGGKTTSAGHRFDLMADAVCDTLLFVGIGVGLRDSALGDWAMVMGLVAGLAIAATFTTVVRIESRAGLRAGEIGSLAGFDPDDAILVVPIVMALDGGVLLLIAAAIGAPSFFAFFIWRNRRRLSDVRRDP